MAKTKKNKVVINGKEYYKTQKRVGKKRNEFGEWVPDDRVFYGSTIKEVNEKIEKCLKELHSSGFSCLGEAIDAYITNFLIPDSRLKDSTKERYVAAYRNNFQDHAITAKPLNDITGLELQAVYNSLSCGPSSVRSIHKLLSKFYKYALSEGLTDRDITANITLPKVQKRQKTDTETVETWSDTELQKIFSGSEGHRLHFLFVLAAGSGLRISELLALRWSDITPENVIMVQRQAYPDPVFDDSGQIADHVQTVRELKTGSSRRSVPLNNDVLQELEKHRQWQNEEMLKSGYRTDYIFTTSTGRLYRQESIRQACRRFYKRIGIEHRSFHCYRHTFASRLAAAGVPIQVVSRILGHSDIAVTSKYYLDISDSEKMDAVQKLSLLTKDA